MEDEARSSRTARSWLRLPLALGLGLVVFVASGTITQVFSTQIQTTPSLQEWLSTVVFQLCMGGLAIVMMLIASRGRLHDFGFRAPTHLPFARLLVAVTAAEAAVTAVFVPFPRTGPSHFAADYSRWQVVVAILLVASTIW